MDNNEEIRYVKPADTYTRINDLLKEASIHVINYDVSGFYRVLKEAYRHSRPFINPTKWDYFDNNFLEINRLVYNQDNEINPWQKNKNYTAAFNKLDNLFTELLMNIKHILLPISKKRRGISNLESDYGVDEN